jgi:hypothetical protein
VSYSFTAIDLLSFVAIEALDGKTANDEGTVVVAQVLPLLRDQQSLRRISTQMDMESPCSLCCCWYDFEMDVERPEKCQRAMQIRG